MVEPLTRANVMPLPSPDGREYWESVSRGELRFQRCASCGTFRHYPAPLCAECHSYESSWELSSGIGALYTWTVVHHAAHPAFANVPYVIAVVELRDCGGPRLVCNLDTDPARLRAGMPIEIWFEERDEGMVPQGRVMSG